MAEINLTYEVIFELVMREKSREELQKLPADFTDQALIYVNRQRNLAYNADETQREALDRQATNSLRLIRDLYERREKKLVNLSLLKVRVESSLIDYGAMLDEERKFFESLVSLMKAHKQVILNSGLEKQKPRKILVEAEEEPEESAPARQEIKKEIPTKLIRFLNPVPKFVGKELEVYGPFEEEEMANLPAEIADILITKGRAEEVGA